VCKCVAKCVKSLYILTMYGFNTVSLDSKGRLAIPAKYRSNLLEKNETKIVVTKDPQYPSLKIYPESEWNEISNKLQSLQGLDPIVRSLQWTILGNAHVIDLDVEGRMLVLIPAELRKYADINDQKQISLVGMGEKFEVWNINNWEMRQMGGSLSTVMNFEVIGQAVENAKIKVVGVGGAGGNAVIHMINHNIEGVDFICANTDTQALSEANGAITLKLGNGLTKGLGAGANPDVGRKAAESDRLAIEELLVGADMVFITAGMGGGTGTGAAPVVASIAKELGALTVAVVTKPFKFEGKRRMSAAEKGLASLVEEVDSLVTIPNQKLYEILGEDTPMQDAFAKADDVLKGAVQGISDIIMKKGHINVDFADVKTVMSEKGIAMMGTGRASGKNRAEAAATQAVKSELLEDINLKNARGVLVNITAAKPTLGDQTEVADIVEEIIHEEANIIYGLVYDETVDDDLLVTIVATGVDQRAPTLVIDNQPSIQLNPVGLRRDDIDQKGGTSSAAEIDFLDVPTFMRKQVD